MYMNSTIEWIFDGREYFITFTESIYIDSFILKNLVILES